MPIYAYRCNSCEVEFDKNLPVSQYQDPQDCPECGAGPAKKLITPTNFVLKGDGFPGKNNRIASQMREKNRGLESKQEARKRDAGVRLSPNVGGERVDSWSEAVKLAESKGKDTSGYKKRAISEGNK